MQGRGQSFKNFVCIFIPICPSTICQSSVVHPFHKINVFFWNLGHLEHLSLVFLVECVPQTSSVSITRWLMQILSPHAGNLVGQDNCSLLSRTSCGSDVCSSIGMSVWLPMLDHQKLMNPAWKNCRYLFVILHSRGLPLSWLVWICWVMLEVMERNRI